MKAVAPQFSTPVPTIPYEMFDAMDPAVVANPYPHYERIRLVGPLVEHPVIGVMVTDYALGTAILKDTSLLANRVVDFLKHIPQHDWPECEFLKAWLERWVLFMDPPQHAPVRALVARAFTPAIVQSLRPRIEALVDELIGGMKGRDDFDFVKDLAYPLPVMVIADLLGVDPKDREALKFWSDELNIFLATPGRNLTLVQRATRAVQDMDAYFLETLERRRKAPQLDLISQLAQAEIDGVGLTDEQILSTCGVVLFGGHETTTNLLGNGLLALLQKPYAFHQLAAHSELLPAAVEEFMRYDSPVQFLGRKTKATTLLAGYEIPADKHLVLALGAIHRDSARFPQPERLRFDRLENRHLGFGLGVHFCPGAALARLEAEIAFGRMLAAFPQMRLVDQPLRYHSTISIRGLSELRVHSK